MNTTLLPQLDDSPRSRVVRSLKQWMDEGVLPAGHPLPSERSLSEQLQVDRGTVRRAISLLSEEGLLQFHNGRTHVVRSNGQPVHGLLTNAVAVVCRPALDPWTGHMQSGWSDYITHGTTHAVRQHGLDVVTLRPESFAARGLATMLADKPRGVIFLDFAPEVASWGQALREAGIPVVIYGGGPELASFDRVVSDHLQGSYLMASWIIRRGQRRPLLIWQGPPELYWYTHRRLGFERALDEFGIPALPTLFVSADRPRIIDEAYFRAAVEKWIEWLRPHLTGPQPVDALVLSSDGPVRYAAAACRAFGLEPNRDIILTGYDNYWAGSEEARFEPATPMATVDKRNLKMGEELVRLWWERTQGQLPPEPQTRRIQPELVVVD